MNDEKYFGDLFFSSISVTKFRNKLARCTSDPLHPTLIFAGKAKDPTFRVESMSGGLQPCLQILD